MQTSAGLNAYEILKALHVGMSVEIILTEAALNEDGTMESYHAGLGDFEPFLTSDHGFLISLLNIRYTSLQSSQAFLTFITNIWG